MSDKNFKVKNGIDSTGPVTITTPNTSTTGLVINVPVGGKAVEFLRNGSYVGAIDDWGGLNTTQGINAAGFWFTRSPGIEAQSFFWAGSSIRSAAGFGGTSTGTNPVIYISSHSTGTNDLTQWLKPDNTIVAKVDYLGNITANDLTLAGNLTVNGTTTNLNSTNLIIEDKNIIIADVATPSDTTADGAGITVKGATDKTFNWVQSTKSFTTSDPLIINNTSTTTVPLIAKGYASQTANHFEVQDSAGNKMFVVNPPAGTLQPLEYFFVRPGGTGGTATIGTNSYSFRVVAANGNSVSFGTPGGGTSLQVFTSDTFNRYKIIGSGTGIAPTFTTDGNDANVNMYVTAKGAGKIGINTTSPTGYVHAVSSSSSTVGLIVEGASGQTSTNIFEVQRAGGGDPSFTVSHNYIDLNRNTTAAASMTVYGANSNQTPLQIKGRASQTADLVSIQQSSGFALARFDANANIVLGNTNVDSNNYLSFIKAGGAVGGNAGIRFGNDADGTNQHTLTVNTSNADLTLEHKNVNSRFIVKGATSQTANLQEWQDSAGNLLSAIRSDGVLRVSQIISKENYSSYFSFSSGSPIQVNPLTSGTVGLVVKAVTSQTANLQEWQNSSGGVDTAVTSTGRLSVRTTLANAGLNVGAPSAATVAAIIRGVASQTADLLQLQNSAGTAIALINASGDFVARNIYASASANYYTAQVNILPDSAAKAGIVIRGVASQTANLQEWQNSSGTVLAKVDSSGSITSNISFAVNNTSGNAIFSVSPYSEVSIPGVIYAGLYATAKLNLLTNNTSMIGAIIRGQTSQTADLQQWQDGAGTVGAYVASDGSFITRGSLIGGSYSGSALFGVQNYSTTQVVAVVKGAASQTANLQEWQNSAGGVLSYITASGALRVNSSFGGTQAAITAGSAATVGVIVRGAASQTADLQQWQDSAGTVLARVYNNGVLSVGSLYAATGDLSVAYGGYFGGGTAGGYIGAAVSVIPWTTAVVGVIVRGRASQTANLQEWQNSSGTMLSKIDKDGIITVPAINVVGQSISSNTTMIAGYRYFVDTSASRTLTLPSSATIGDEIQIFDSTNTAGTNNITINSNNGKIEGVVESYIIDVNGAAIVMTYTGSTYGWKVRM